jgi:hypothetical protein
MVCTAAVILFIKSGMFTGCLKLLIPASNVIERWGITVELLPESPLNRNN